MTDASPPSDLAPRVPRSAGRRWLPRIIIVVVLGAVAVLLVTLISSATLFVYEADKAVEQRDQLGDDRFRLIGTPVEGTIVDAELEGRGAVFFTVSFNGVLVDVAHVGDPPELFRSAEGVVPVFLEGHWSESGSAGIDDFVGGADDGWFFASDTMRVKHDEDYRNDNEERIAEAERDGQP